MAGLGLGGGHVAALAEKDDVALGDADVGREEDGVDVVLLQRCAVASAATSSPTRQDCRYARLSDPRRAALGPLRLVNHPYQTRTQNQPRIVPLFARVLLGASVLNHVAVQESQSRSGAMQPRRAVGDVTHAVCEPQKHRQTNWWAHILPP
jgi:hypothetical protein